MVSAAHGGHQAPDEVTGAQVSVSGTVADGREDDRVAARTGLDVRAVQRDPVPTDVLEPPTPLLMVTPLT